MNVCPCGSRFPYGMCCGPILSGNKPAETAESLMRSRYTAYVEANVDYLIQTYVAHKKHRLRPSHMRHSIQNTRWIGLTIIGVLDGRAQHNTGEVEFKARFIFDGRVQELHERSRFIREDGLWRYWGQA
ncbi:MAG: YchJ family metal-binding protein [Myxococcota bacterium]|nr:YchJ family metal-binding protein [Myxococcota bacterium]